MLQGDFIVIPSPIVSLSQTFLWRITLQGNSTQKAFIEGLLTWGSVTGPARIFWPRWRNYLIWHHKTPSAYENDNYILRLSNCRRYFYRSVKFVTLYFMLKLGVSWKKQVPSNPWFEVAGQSFWSYTYCCIHTSHSFPILKAQGPLSQRNQHGLNWSLIQSESLKSWKTFHFVQIGGTLKWTLPGSSWQLIH